MNKRVLTLVLIGLLLGSALGQQIDVLKTVVVADGQSQYFTSPQFSPDGTKILFSESGFKGLWLYDMNRKTTTQINDLPGAGYEPSFTKDSKQVIFRTDNYIKYKRYSSLAVQTIADKQIEYIAKDVRFMSPASVLEDQTIVYRKGDEVAAYNTSRKEALQAKAAQETYGFIEDEKIILVVDGVRNEIKPMGDNNYIWFSLSPDKTKMLFTVAGGGTFITDLAGNVQVRLGKANAPKWSPDGKWIVYMVDEDDGHTMTASDIWAAASDGALKVRLTETAADIEMYPAWSPAMDRIVFETFGGKIAYMNIEITD
ncbi:MAG: hypothetical protein PHW79_00910 [Candidatus Marinimicrobia bacterium]|nr:hypothetical protein [Candidatus Neomarinimicrobiota bacterium]